MELTFLSEYCTKYCFRDPTPYKAPVVLDPPRDDLEKDFSRKVSYRRPYIEDCPEGDEELTIRLPSRTKTTLTSYLPPSVEDLDEDDDDNTSIDLGVDMSFD